MARLEGGGAPDRALARAVSGPLPKEEFDRVFSRVPRLTVELVIVSSDTGVLLALRDFGPCKGLWHLPGGTVRFGEPLVEAVKRVAKDELGVDVEVGELLGYIEYPSHYNNGLDSPVGLAFQTQVAGDLPDVHDLLSECAWFSTLPDNMHDEQKTFLTRRRWRTAEPGNMTCQDATQPTPRASTPPHPPQYQQQAATTEPRRTHRSRAATGAGASLVESAPPGASGRRRPDDRNTRRSA